MTFRDYLTQRAARADAAGDFVRLARNDGEMPEAAAWQELRTYLESKGGWGSLMDAGQQVWEDYQKKLRQSRAS